VSSTPDWWINGKNTRISLSISVIKEDAVALMLKGHCPNRIPGWWSVFSKHWRFILWSSVNKDYAALHFQINKNWNRKRENGKLPGSLDAKLADLSSAGL
jgi:hypothetical protein